MTRGPEQVADAVCVPRTSARRLNICMYLDTGADQRMDVLRKEASSDQEMRRVNFIHRSWTAKQRSMIPTLSRGPPISNGQ
jgi:hypothetical protein